MGEMRVAFRDITRPLSRGFPSWPGDPPFVAEEVSSIGRGDPWTVTRIAASVHAGSHLDAPSHVLWGGADVASIPLDVLIGPALVLDVTGPPKLAGESPGLREAASPAPGAPRILEAGELLRRLEGALPGAPPRADRFLIRTESAETLPALPVEYTGLSVAAAELLVRAGARLVGIDTPSVDAPGAGDLPVHHVFARAGVPTLEWLDLRGVPEGLHTLIALPLRLEGMEGSPVRAVLAPAPWPGREPGGREVPIPTD